MKAMTRWLAAMVCIVCLCISGQAYAGDNSSVPSPTPTFDLLSLLTTPSPIPYTPTNTFTPDGVGTVLDNVTGADGKEFYTIMTPSENVFYLVIDKQRSGENVYFLSAVTERDLLALAAEAGLEPTPTPAPLPTLEPIQEVAAPEPEKKAPSMGKIVGVLLVLAGGAGFYYFKFMRPQHGQDEQEDEDYEGYGDYEDAEAEGADLDQAAPEADVYDEPSEQ